MGKTKATAYIIHQDTITAQEVEDNTEVSRATSFRILDDLKEAGYIEKIERGVYNVLNDPNTTPNKYWDSNISTDKASKVERFEDQGFITTDHIADFTNIDPDIQMGLAENLKEAIDVRYTEESLDVNGRYKWHDIVKVDPDHKGEIKGSINSFAHTVSHELGHAIDYGDKRANNDMRNLELISELILYPHGHKYSRDSQVSEELRRISMRVRSYQHKTITYISDNSRNTKIDLDKNYSDSNTELFADYIASLTLSPYYTATVGTKTLRKLIELDENGSECLDHKQEKRLSSVLEETNARYWLDKVEN